MIYDILCNKSPSDIASGLRGPSVETVRAREWAEGNEQVVSDLIIVSPPSSTQPLYRHHSRTDSLNSQQPEETENEDDNLADPSLTSSKVASGLAKEGNIPLQLIRTFLKRAAAISPSPIQSLRGSSGGVGASAAVDATAATSSSKATRMWVGGKGTDSVVVMEDTSRNITRLWNRMMSRVQLRGQTGQGCINLAAHVIRGTSWVLGQRAQETHREVSLFTSSSIYSSSSSSSSSSYNNPIKLISHILDSINKSSNTSRVPPISHHVVKDCYRCSLVASLAASSLTSRALVPTSGDHRTRTVVCMRRWYALHDEG
jgi:hypothetical protein